MMGYERIGHFRLTISAFCAVFLLTGCEKESIEYEELIRPVRYMEMQSTLSSQARVFSGISRDTAATKISFRVNGRVDEINMKVGDIVQKGQEIIKLDQADFRLRVSEAQAGLDQAKASARNADAVLKRVRGLYENNNASRNELDAARAQAEAAKALVASIQNQLGLARRQLSYTVMKAPAECDVAIIDVEVNENVQAGQPIGLLGCGGETEVKVVVPGSVIARIREGDSAKVTFSAIENVVYPAVVTEVGVAATEVGTTFPVIVKITEQPFPVHSGLAGEVEFKLGNLGASEERLLVPLAAVGEDLGGRFVFALESAESGQYIVRRKAVETGEMIDGSIALVSGVEPGEKVVTAGVSQLKDGQKVRLYEGGGSTT